MHLPGRLINRSYASVTVDEGKVVAPARERQEDDSRPWMCDEGFIAPPLTAEVRQCTMSVQKKVYPTSDTAMGYRLQHWAIVLKALDNEKEFLFEFSPNGVILNTEGQSAHAAFLHDDEDPLCTDLGNTVKTIDEVKAWIFSKYKIFRDLNWDGYGAQKETEITGYNAVSNNCQNFVMCLADFLRTPISTHSQATEVLGSIGAVGGLALAGVHAPIVIGVGAVLAVAASFGVLEHVTENAGIAKIGDGIQGLASGVDMALGGAPRAMANRTMKLGMTGAGAVMAVTNVARHPSLQTGPVLGKKLPRLLRPDSELIAPEPVAVKGER